MSKAKDGGAAFPMPGSDGYNGPELGMSLRAWIAGQVAAGMMANPLTMEVISKNYGESKMVAATAVGLADALLVELELDDG